MHIIKITYPSYFVLIPLFSPHQVEGKFPDVQWAGRYLETCTCSPLRGFFPARVLVRMGHTYDITILNIILQRTYLRDPNTKTNIPIQAIGLSLYESLPSTTAEQLGTQVVRTQWLWARISAIVQH